MPMKRLLHRFRQWWKPDGIRFRGVVIGVARQPNQFVTGSIPGDVVIRYNGRILVSLDNGCSIHAEIPAAK